MSSLAFFRKITLSRFSWRLVGRRILPPQSIQLKFFTYSSASFLSDRMNSSATFLSMKWMPDLLLNLSNQPRLALNESCESKSVEVNHSCLLTNNCVSHGIPCKCFSCTHINSSFYISSWSVVRSFERLVTSFDGVIVFSVSFCLRIVRIVEVLRSQTP